MAPRGYPETWAYIRRLYFIEKFPKRVIAKDEFKPQEEWWLNSLLEGMDDERRQDV